MTFLFILLYIIQTILLIPILLVFANYYEDDDVKSKNKTHQTILTFMTSMICAEGAIWLLTECAALFVLPGGIQVEIAALCCSLPVNVIFITSLLFAVFHEIHIRKRLEV